LRTKKPPLPNYLVSAANFFVLCLKQKRAAHQVKRMIKEVAGKCKLFFIMIFKAQCGTLVLGLREDEGAGIFAWGGIWD